MNESFITWIHPLINLIDNTERSFRHILQRHQIENGTDTAFPSRLSLSRQQLQLLCLPKLDFNLNRPFLEIVRVGGIFLVADSFRQEDFTCTTNRCEGIGESCGNAFHHVFKRSFPEFAVGGDLCSDGVDFSLTSLD